MSFQELINSDQPVLVDFYAEWCGPCKTLAPVLKDVAGKMEGRGRVIKVDIDKNPAAAEKYRISAVPTMLIFKKGNPLWRQSGVLSATQLVQTMESFI